MLLTASQETIFLKTEAYTLSQEQNNSIHCPVIVLASLRVSGLFLCSFKIH